MADTKLSSTVREVLLEFDVLPTVYGAIRETLSGAPIGPDDIIGTTHAVREVLLEFDVLPVAAGAIRETLYTTEPVVEYATSTPNVIREVLIGEPPFQLSTAIRETLMFTAGEAVSLRHRVGAFWQDALIPRATPDPAGIKSFGYAGTLHETVAVRKVMPAVFSSIEAKSLQRMSVAQITTLPAQQVRSNVEVAYMARMAVMSRGQAYVPLSEIRVTMQRQFVTMKRTMSAAPLVRSVIEARTLAQHVVQSRVQGAVVIMTDAFVVQHMQQVVQERAPGNTRSDIEASTLRELVVQTRTVTPPGIDDRVAGYQQIVAMARARSAVIGQDQVKGLRSLVAQHRTMTRPFSRMNAATLHAAVVIGRVTYPPSLTIGTHAATLAMQVVREISMPTYRSPHFVAGMQITFTLAKKVPRPIDVIDPSVGRHVPSLRMFVLQHRVTTPPDVISKQSRYVFNVLAQAAIGDKFPPPDMPEPIIPETFVNQVAEQVVQRDEEEWAPVSVLTVRAAGESLVVGDNAGWIDPTVPNSDVLAGQVVQPVAVSAVFPDPAMPQSDALVAGVQSVAVVGDSTMPDPAIPQSEIQVNGVTEFAAVGDAGWPDPTIPLSEVSVQRVGAVVAVRDPSLIGQFGMSEITSTSVMQFYVTRDPTMKGVALRQGPRPVVSVTIS